MGAKVWVSVLRTTFQPLCEEIAKYYCVALFVHNLSFHNLFQPALWGEHIYIVKSQGAQNYVAYDVLLSLLWGARNFVHRKIKFFQPWLVHLKFWIIYTKVCVYFTKTKVCVYTCRSPKFLVGIIRHGSFSSSFSVIE